MYDQKCSESIMSSLYNNCSISCRSWSQTNFFFYFCTLPFCCSHLAFFLFFTAVFQNSLHVVALYILSCWPFSTSPSTNHKRQMFILLFLYLNVLNYTIFHRNVFQNSLFVPLFIHLFVCSFLPSSLPFFLLPFLPPFFPLPTSPLISSFPPFLPRLFSVLKSMIGNHCRKVKNKF